MRKIIVTTHLVFIATILFFLSIASAEILQLTDNDYPDQLPRIDDGQVIWQGGEEGEVEIYFWDGTDTQQISTGNGVNYDHQIDNGKVVWSSEGLITLNNESFFAYQLLYWDGTDVELLYNNNNNHPLRRAAVSNGEVVWDEDDQQIILWDGTDLVYIDDSGYVLNAQIHNGEVVYYSFNDSAIYYWDGKSYTTTGVYIQKIASAYQYDVSPQPKIHNGQAVWQSYDYDDMDYEVFYWNGTEVKQLTDNSYDDIYPQIHNGQVVWYGKVDNEDYEIFLWEGGEVQQLTNNTYQDYRPQINNGQIVWTMDDESRNSSQIVLYNGDITEQLTDSYDSENLRPQINNGQVVWYGASDGDDYEIFLWEDIQAGDLIVSIEPSEAAAAGAQWCIDNGDWYSSGYTASDLEAGEYTVSFKTISGWTTPDDQTVTISSDATTSINATYVQQEGALQVTINPSEAGAAGAQWKVDGGDWHDSDDTESNLSLGVHTVEFQEISGWSTPITQKVTIYEDQTTVTTGTYEEDESVTSETDQSNSSVNSSGGGGGGCFINTLT